MKFDDINIIEASIGGKIKKIKYDHIRESRPYTIEEEETPHPDMLKAFYAFKKDMAEAYYHLSNETIDNFSIDGFAISEDSKSFSICLKGKMITSHKDSVTVNSGNIPVEGDVVEKLATVREELFKYLFEGKSAQGELPFPKKDGEEAKDE